MFEHSEKRKLEKMKFSAAMQGVDIGEKKKEENLMFPHPDTFKDMSDEEKKEKTRIDMARHQKMLPNQMRM